MTEKDLIEAYKFCLENGWVHNTPEDNIIIDYKYRQKLFNEHLKKIIDHVKKNELDTIHILIGEAPPYYPNDIFPLRKNRNYFYDTDHNSTKTHYFKKPCDYFLNKRESTKEELLKQLAATGVLIFDIFPFPIFQTTDNRKRVNLKDNESEQSEIQKSSLINDSENSNSFGFFNFLDTHFCSRLEELIRDFEEIKNVKFYLFAPKYTSIQFLSWCYSGDENCEIKKRLQVELINFGNCDDRFQFLLDTDSFYTDDTKKFINKVGNPEGIKDAISKHPIFMDKSGNPNFNEFINGRLNPAHSTH